MGLKNKWHTTQKKYPCFCPGSCNKPCSCSQHKANTCFPPAMMDKSQALEFAICSLSLSVKPPLHWAKQAGGSVKQRGAGRSQRDWRWIQHNITRTTQGRRKDVQIFEYRSRDQGWGWGVVCADSCTCWLAHLLSSVSREGEGNSGLCDTSALNWGLLERDIDGARGTDTGFSSWLRWRLLMGAIENNWLLHTACLLFQTITHLVNLCFPLVSFTLFSSVPGSDLKTVKE